MRRGPNDEHEITVRNKSKKLRAEIKWLAKNIGVTRSRLLREMCTRIVADHPDEMKVPLSREEKGRADIVIKNGSKKLKQELKCIAEHMGYPNVSSFLRSEIYRRIQAAPGHMKLPPTEDDGC